MRVVRLFCCFCLLLTIMFVISPPITTLAATPPEEKSEQVEIKVTYPSLEVTPGGSAQFEVEINYESDDQEDEPLNFSLMTTGPKNWDIYITQKYSAAKGTRIRGIKLDPVFPVPMKLEITVTPQSWTMPEPGEYTVTLEVVSEDQVIRKSVDLTVIISDTYILALVPTTERYNTSAIVGQDNYFTMEIQSGGTGTVDELEFSANKPADWVVTFSPDEIGSLSGNSSQEIKVNIQPPTNAMVGDYNIVLNCDGKQTSAKGLLLKVTVEKSTFWGWVGVGIIAVVIACVLAVFRRFGRR